MNDVVEQQDELIWNIGEGGADGVTELLSAAESVAAALQQSFHTYRHSQIICFRSRRGSGFWHSKTSAALSVEGSRLCALLERHAVLRLLADCEARVASFRRFVHALERLALHSSEHMPAGVRAFASAADDGGYSEDEGGSCSGGFGGGGLARLSHVCDELRSHLTHWSSLSRCALDSPRLRIRLRRVEPALAEARSALARLRHASVCWLERLARAGVRSFARADSDASLVALVCSTVHGVEEFNALLGAIGRALALEDGLLMTNSGGGGGSRRSESLFHWERSQPPQQPDPRGSTAATGGWPGAALPQTAVAGATLNYLRWTHATSTNSPSQLDLRAIKSMSFVRFLAALATERAREEALRSLQALVSDGSGVGTAASSHSCTTGASPDAGLRPGVPSTGGVVSSGSGSAGAVLPLVRVGGAVPAYKRMGNFVLAAGDRIDTSDYHSATGSALSMIGGRQSHHGSIAELSPAETELLNWSQTEQDYVGKVIAIACHMTSMLHKSIPKGSALRSGNAELAAAAAGSCTPKSDPKRKSVSWGDSHDNTVKANLINKYADLLWKAFGTALSECIKNKMSWGRSTALSKRVPASGSLQLPIGSIDFCPTAAVLRFAHCLEKLAAGGTLSSSCARQLDFSALRLEATAMLAQWDSSLCVVLASIRTDKCQPVPLADGQYSTKTAMLLRNAFGALQNLQLSFEKRFGTRRKGVLATQQPVSEYRIQWEILQRLQILADITEHWCQQKCVQFIYDFRLSQFLLVAYSDLPILATELGKCLCLLSCDGPTSSDPFPAQWHRLSVSFGRTEALSRQAAASLSKKSGRKASEFFADTLPPPKSWRKDASGAAPPNKSPCEYVHSLTEQILQPLLDGCRQLSAAAQAATIACVVRSVLDAWMQQFLQQKIKFSWDGADQLEADVRGVREWLLAGVSSEEVRRAVIEAEPFRVITGVVQLLKRQPCKRRAAPVGAALQAAGAGAGAAGAGGAASRTSNGSAAVPGGGGSSGGSGAPDSIDEMDYASAVPDKSAWLSLRQRGPGRAVRLFLPCMNSSPASSLAV